MELWTFRAQNAKDADGNMIREKSKVILILLQIERCEVQHKNEAKLKADRIEG